MLVGWLRYNATEVANAARTLDYIATQLTGLGGLSVDGDCGCDAVDEGPYTTPANDDAPWYESTRPESGRFYGLLIDDMRFLPGWSRSVEQLPRGGASLGPPILPGRTLAVSGVLFASEASAMTYGQAWLTEVLSCGCEGCGIADLCVLPACPPVDGCEDDYFRVIRAAGLTDGPVFSALMDDRCHMTRVSFQMASSFGFLFGDPILTAEGTLSPGS